MDINVIESLIMKYCPNGVMYQTLNELGSFYSGLSGKCKKDFVNGNCKFITYINIYNNPAVNILVNDMVQIEDDEKQNSIEYGDVLFTGSSETPDECGFSSVVVDKIKEKIYLNSFCFGFRLTNKKLYSPNFLKYLFRSEEVRKKIKKTASGVTRFNVSKTKFGKISIPVPPLPVQEEIVRILDSYSELETKLEAKLEAELDARKKQYEYYKNKLLNSENISGEDIKFLPLSEIAYYPNKRIDARFVNEDNYVSVENLLKDKQGKTKSTSVPTQGSVIEYIENDILIGNIRPYLKKIWLATNTGGTNGDVVLVRIKNEQKQQITPDFLYHILMSEKFFDYDNQYARGAKMPRGNKDMILKYSIPLPPIEKQKRIVAILDEFNKLTNEISDSLQAEITARKKQYEYYRNKLLTFKEAV